MVAAKAITFQSPEGEVLTVQPQVVAAGVASVVGFSPPKGKC